MTLGLVTVRVLSGIPGRRRREPGSDRRDPFTYVVDRLFGPPLNLPEAPKIHQLLNYILMEFDYRQDHVSELVQA